MAMKIQDFFGGPITCSRQAYLEEQDGRRQFDKDWKECQMMKTAPGYETLMSIRGKAQSMVSKGGSK